MLHAAMKKMDTIGHGVIVYLNKLRQGGGILDELSAYKALQGSGHSVPKRMDSKDYGIGAQIIRQLGVRNCHVLTNTPRTLGPIGYGLTITNTSRLDLDIWHLHSGTKKGTRVPFRIVEAQSLSFFLFAALLVELAILLSELVNTAGSIYECALPV